MNPVDYHGDDYAISINNSTRMLELAESGKLNSMSILPNMGGYRECIDLLNSRWDTMAHKPLLSIHLNLIDGFSLSGCTNPMLCNDRGIIDCSWGKLFIHSYLPGKARKLLKEDIRSELRAQIDRVYKDLPAGMPLRLDSHVHTHMIPLVFDAMTDALKDLGLLDRVEFIRVADEPLLPFLTTPGVTFTFPPVNLLKNRILHLLAHRVNRKLKSIGIRSSMLWGLCMSGRMDKRRIDRIADKMIRYSHKWNKNLEIYCHPGIVLDTEMSEEYGRCDVRPFVSANRDIEYEAVMNRSI